MAVRWYASASLLVKINVFLNLNPCIHPLLLTLGVSKKKRPANPINHRMPNPTSGEEHWKFSTDFFRGRVLCLILFKPNSYSSGFQLENPKSSNWKTPSLIHPIFNPKLDWCPIFPVFPGFSSIQWSLRAWKGPQEAPQWCSSPPWHLNGDTRKRYPPAMKPWVWKWETDL